MATENIDIVISETGGAAAADAVRRVGTEGEAAAAKVDALNTASKNVKVALDATGGAGLTVSKTMQEINSAAATASTGMANLSTVSGRTSAAFASTQGYAQNVTTSLGAVGNAAKAAAPPVTTMATETEKTNTSLGKTPAATAPAATGLTDVGAGAGGATPQITGMGQATALLRDILVTVGVVKLVNDLKQLSDTFAGMINRLKLVSTSGADLVATQQKLLDISNRTRGSFENTSNLYTKLALNAGQLGIETKTLLPTLETINQLIAISGTSASEAQNGLQQFSQGLASNKFAGDELRSVLENIPALGQAIAKGLGVTTAGLRKMGEDGQLSAKLVLDALAKSAPEIQKQFASITPTIGGAIQVLKNNILQAVGTFDQLNNGGSRLAAGILFLANYVTTFAKVIATAGIAVAAFYVGMAVQTGWSTFAAGVAAANVRLQTYIAFTAAAGIETTIFSRALIAFQTPIAAVTGLFRTLWAVIAANPFTAILTALGLIGTALYFFGNAVKLNSDGSITALGAVVGILKLLYNGIVQVGTYVVSTLGPAFTAFGTVVSTVFNAVMNALAGLLGWAAQFIPQFAPASAAVSGFRDTLVQAMKDGTTSMADATLASKDFGTQFATTSDSVISSAGETKKAVNGLSDSLVQAGRVNADAIPPFMNLVNAAKRAEEQAARSAAAWKKYCDDVDRAAEETAKLALVTRNAMGEMTTATDEWARRSGANFNSVRDAANGASSAISSAQSSSSSGGGGGSSNDDYNTSRQNGNTGGGSFQELVYSPLGDVIRKYNELGGTSRNLGSLISTLEFWLNAGDRARATSAAGDVGRSMAADPAAAKSWVKQERGFLDFWVKQAGVTGFATGGAFSVGGTGGADSQLIQFMATPGERVTIETPGQSAMNQARGQRNSAGKNIVVNMNVTTADANSFRRSGPQTLLQLRSRLANVG